MIDQQRPEAVLLGQPKKAGTRSFLRRLGFLRDPWRPAPRRSHFARSTTKSILRSSPTLRLDAKTDLRMRAEVAGERILIFQLARALNVDAVTGEHGESLTLLPE